MPKPPTGRRRVEKLQSAPKDAGAFRWPVVLIAVGILLRLGIAMASIGTNDAAAWLRFGDEINQHGLLETYRLDRDFNHPPIPGYWAAFCARIAGPEDSSWHDSIFTNVFKLPAILADCGGIYVLWLIWRRRIAASGALAIAAVFALSPDAILISGFHCNTDSIYVALCLLSLYLLEDRQCAFAAGLALGAAINVKLIPVLLALPLLLSIRKPAQILRFILGLAACAIPFVPLLMWVGKPFFSNVLQYNSMVDRWGIDYFLLLGERHWNPAHHGEQLTAAYYARARYLIFGLILLWALWARCRDRWNGYQIVMVTFAIFLIFVPGFGVQYTAMIGLILFAIRPSWAGIYAMVAGIFVGSAYWVYWTGAVPFYSQWSSSLLPEPAGVLGLLTWILIVVLTARTVAKPGREP